MDSPPPVAFTPARLRTTMKHARRPEKGKLMPPGEDAVRPDKPASSDVPAVELLSRLGETAQQLSRQQPLDEVCQTVADHAAALLHAELSVVCLYENDNTSLRLHATSHPEIQTGEVFASLDAAQAWGVAALQQVLTGQAAVAPCDPIYTPIAFQGQALGMLGIYALPARAAAWSPAHWQAVGVLAAQAGGAISHARAAQALHRQQELVTGLERAEQGIRSVTRSMLRSSSPRQVASRWLEYCHSCVPFDSGAVLLNEDKLQFRVLALYGAANTPHRFTPLSYHHFPFLRRVLIHRETIRLGNVSQDPHWRPHLPGHVGGSWLAVPLASSTGIPALVSLGCAQTNFFTAEHARLLELLTVPLGLMLENINLRLARPAPPGSELAQRIVTAQEEERKRVSRELHDEAGQSLTALSLNLEFLTDELRGQNQSLVERARESVQMTRRTMDQLLQLAKQLRPPALDMLGLDAAVRQLCIDMARRAQVNITYQGEDPGKLPDETSLAVYRAVQEALTNAVKYAQTDRIEVTLHRRRHELVAQVRDYGKGFDPAAPPERPRTGARLGLVGMQERLAMVNGHVEIKSVPGEGTLLTASVALSKSPGESE